MSMISAMTMLKMLNETEKDLLEMNARMKKDRASATIDKIDFCGELCLFAEGLIKKAKPKWIPVSERLPEEHESIFKKFYGTNKWTSAMFQTVSDNVLVVVSHKDGSKTVKTMCTLDGEWRIADGRPWNVTHWMPLPEPPEG